MLAEKEIAAHTVFWRNESPLQSLSWSSADLPTAVGAGFALQTRGQGTGYQGVPEVVRKG